LFFFEGKTSEPENDSGYALDTLGNTHLIERPEQWQVVEWLRVNHGIWIEVGYGFNPSGFYWLITLIKEKKSKHSENDAFQPSFSSPQEAYSAAFDYIRHKMSL
jgi:hypothetical protein